MTTFLEPVMPWKTLKEWKSESSAGWFTKRKNKSLLEVDDYFDRWLAASAKKDYKGEVQQLHLLILSCKAWLDAKALKKNSTRKPSMEKMYKNAMARLLWVNYWKQKELGKPENKKLAELKGRYKIEALSAPKGQDRVNADALAMAQKKGDRDLIAQMTDEELAEFAGNLLEVALENPRAVVLKYMNLAQRAECQLLFLEDSTGTVKIHQKQKDAITPLTTGTVAGRKTLKKLQQYFLAGAAVWAYAVDQYGNFFAQKQPNVRGEFHHSSFTSGKPVLCAGMIVIENGDLCYIDNGSGHYKPTVENLLDALDALKNIHALDISSTVVGVLSEEKNKFFIEEFANADDFLTNGGKGKSQGKLQIT